MRRFFDEFARVRNFDPLDPLNWYQVRYKDVADAGGASILTHFGDTLCKALLTVYPDIGLNVEKLNRNSNWENENDRRSFFIHFARENGFDPLDADHWYKISTKEIESKKGGPVILKAYYKGSLFGALKELFPTLQLVPYKFKRLPRGAMSDSHNRRMFFDGMAIERGLNPLIVDSWYHIKQKDVVSNKGGSKVLSYHDQRYDKAVIELYPELPFDLSKLQSRKTEGQCYTNAIQ